MTFDGHDQVRLAFLGWMVLALEAKENPGGKYYNGAVDRCPVLKNRNRDERAEKRADNKEKGSDVASRPSKRRMLDAPGAVSE